MERQNTEILMSCVDKIAYPGSKKDFENIKEKDGRIEEFCD